MSKQNIEIRHKPSGELIAHGPKGWGIFPFEGNYYIGRKYLKTDGFKFSGIPGICPYKFVYFWYHFAATSGDNTPMLGWVYWLPNPLFPFIAFRVAVPAKHPDIVISISSIV
ncbi:MAG: hypothetical protein ACI8QD_002925 [Cyclobacteriaceae bacterium]|jgi:uncharacterized protein (DUF427 family)